MKEGLRVGLISPYGRISSIGLRQIAACLREAGHETKVLCLPDPQEWLYCTEPHGESYPQRILDQVCELMADVDLVGIGVMSNYVGRARALTDALHESVDAMVIWGGIHATVMPEESLRWADMACIGEGDEAIVELADRMAAGRSYSAVRNIWLRGRDGELVGNPVRPLHRTLDDFPLVDYCAGSQYVLHNGAVVALTPRLLHYYMHDHSLGQSRVVYEVCLARGCPYNCAYCCANALRSVYPDWRRVRRRSAKHVIAEIKKARANVPGIEAVHFYDDTFMDAEFEELAAFAALYQDEVGLPFYALVTPGSVTTEKLTCLTAAGMNDVEMGIQTGSPRTQALYHRPAGNDRVLAAANKLNEVSERIPCPRYDVISDNPWETTEDHLETLRLLYELPRPYKLYLFSLTFYPGTEVYERAKAEGLITDELRDVYDKNYNQLEASYYNFALWMLHRGGPRWLLWLAIQSLSVRVFGSWLFRLPVRLLWGAINWYRTRDNLRMRRRRLVDSGYDAPQEVL